MRHFHWGQENEVFLAQIDAEHRDLFQAAEQLETAVQGKASAAQIDVYLASLVDHLQNHFAHEEWLMQSTGYPSYSWHKQQHETARRRLKLFVPLIQIGNQEGTELFFEFLSGWLEDHTTVTDRMMGAYVRNFERAHGRTAFQGWSGSRDNGGAAPAAPPEPRAFPKTVQFCRVCGDQTAHELRPGGPVCLKCIGRSVSAELDRD